MKDKISVTGKIVTQYADKFLGYGNLKAPLWFIGMEPGAPKNAMIIIKHLKAWRDAGAKKVGSAKEHHLKTGVEHYSRYFEGKGFLQKTWGGIAKILLHIEGKTVNGKSAKEFLKNSFCNTDSDHCTLELMPLPSYSTKEWPYKQSGIQEFQSREKYYHNYRNKRIQIFRRLIKKHVPKVVVFYGFSYNNFWNQIIDGVDFFEFLYETKNKKPKIYTRKNDDTLFLIVSQFSARGVDDVYLKKISDIIKPFMKHNK